MAELINRTVVVLARQFNPAIVTERWLARNGIIAEDAQLEGTVQMPVFSRFRIDGTEFLIIGDRMQATIVDDGDAAAATGYIDRIVQMLPETPYTAVGLNIHWRIPVADEIGVFSHRNFVNHESAFAQAVGLNDSVFGSVVHRPACGGLLRLDVKPRQEDANLTGFDAAFNYHYNIPETDGAGSVSEALRHWAEAETDTARIVEAIR